MINQNIRLHNRWDVQVVDAATGKVKQEAVGYNIVTNGLFKLLCGDFSSSYGDGTRSGYLLGKMWVGNGTREPSVNDTGRSGTQSFSATPTTYAPTYGYPTTSRVYKMTIGVTDYNGYAISECGFNVNVYGYGVSIDNHCMTRALLKDSEGNQISILKTDVDVVYVTATVYCTFDTSNWGDSFIPVLPEHNRLIKSVFSLDQIIKVKSCLGVKKYKVTDTYDGYEESNYYYGEVYDGFNVANELTSTYDDVNFTRTYETTFTTATGNFLIMSILLNGVGKINFPNHDIFPPYPISNEFVGTGDGVTTEFGLKCPIFMDDGLVIRVNDVEMVRGVDYTIDFNANSPNLLQLYASAKLTAKDDNVTFGNLKNKSGEYYRNGRHDPVSFAFMSRQSAYPSYCTVSTSYPIKIDFLEPTRCNRLVFANITVPASYVDKLIIQHSDDGSAWQTVTYTRTEQVYAFDTVTARYWRCYLEGYSWNYYLDDYVPDKINGYTTGATFFLGYTGPAITFATPPAQDASIAADYKIDIPYKTTTNIFRTSWTVQYARGDGT